MQPRLMSWGVFGWTREILHTAPGKATAELKRIDEGPAVGTQREAPLNRGGLLLSIYRSLSAGPAVGLDHEAIRVADDGSYRLPLRSPREAGQTYPPPAPLPRSRPPPTGCIPREANQPAFLPPDPSPPGRKCRA